MATPHQCPSKAGHCMEITLGRNHTRKSHSPAFSNQTLHLSVSTQVQSQFLFLINLLANPSEVVNLFRLKVDTDMPV